MVDVAVSYCDFFPASGDADLTTGGSSAVLSRSWSVSSLIVLTNVIPLSAACHTVSHAVPLQAPPVRWQVPAQAPSQAPPRPPCPCGDACDCRRPCPTNCPASFRPPGYPPAPAGYEWVRDPRGPDGWGLRQKTLSASPACVDGRCSPPSASSPSSPSSPSSSCPGGRCSPPSASLYPFSSCPGGRCSPPRR